jgi:hypothetical protein
MQLFHRLDLLMDDRLRRFRLVIWRCTLLFMGINFDNPSSQATTLRTNTRARAHTHTTPTANTHGRPSNPTDWETSDSLRRFSHNW